jgi:hypothetical protein
MALQLTHGFPDNAYCSLKIGVALPRNSWAKKRPGHAKPELRETRRDCTTCPNRRVFMDGDPANGISRGIGAFAVALYDRVSDRRTARTLTGG